MTKTKCFRPISFDDAEFDSFRLENETLIIKVILWDGEECEIVFKNTLFFSKEMSYLGFMPYEMTEIDILKEYINFDANLLEKYKVFCFEDLNDNPAAIVVAESGVPRKLPRKIPI